MGVQKSAYRQPVTPEGLKAIEEGKLTWLDDEMYNNLNTGVLEQYLEEKAKSRSEAAAKSAATRARNRRILDSLETSKYKPQKVKL